MEDGRGFARPGESEQAAALAEQRERLLGDDPEPLPALGGLGVGVGCCLVVAAGLDTLQAAPALAETDALLQQATALSA